MSKTVVITGASGGIGQAIAQKFALQPYNVVLQYYQNEHQARMLAQDLAQQGIRTLLVQADVAKEQQVVALIEQANSAFGGIDVLVNNAGVSLVKQLQDTTLLEWEHLFGVNVSGTFLCARAVLPQMIQNKQGVIVNISSMWGISGASCEVAYSSSKAAVIGFTKALAQEVAPSNIRVNCVAPGVITTPMNDLLGEEVLSQLALQTPLGRLGTPQDIAEAVCFLASDQASFITGAVLAVDGGTTLG